MFTATLVATVVVCVLLETYSSQGTVGLIPPPYGPSRSYLTVDYDYPNKRLGNLLFNFASTLGIARMTNMTPIYGRDFALVKYFRLNVTLVDDIDNAMGMSVGYDEYGSRACAYDPFVERLRTINTRLHGYYQSWKYFRQNEHDLRAHLHFRFDVLSRAQEFLRMNTPPQWKLVPFTRVGIHVRRGDILRDYFQNYGYTVATEAYFARAMALFKEQFPRIQFVVCSDDIAWCREHVRDESVVYSEGNSPIIDLAILSSCDHVIMSTGSFSWWAAWLAGGMAVYYDDWPRPMSQLEYFVTKSDYFYPTWAPISMKDRHWKRRVKLTPMYTRSDTFSVPVKTTSNKSLL